MGGYGATRIGMKHSDVFGSLYIMSPCCCRPRPAGPASADLEKVVAARRRRRTAEPAVLSARSACHGGGMVARSEESAVLFRSADQDGVPQPDVLAKWAANAPLAFIDQYIGDLRQYRAIAIDVGDQDGLRTDTGTLHEVLGKYGIANSFECTTVPTRAQLPIAFRTTSCRSSAGIVFGTNCK